MKAIFSMNNFRFFYFYIAHTTLFLLSFRTYTWIVSFVISLKIPGPHHNKALEKSKFKILFWIQFGYENVFIYARQTLKWKFNLFSPFFSICFCFILFWARNKQSLQVAHNHYNKTVITLKKSSYCYWIFVLF